MRRAFLRRVSNRTIDSVLAEPAPFVLQTGLADARLASVGSLIAEAIGADKLIYQDLEDLVQAVRHDMHGGITPGLDLAVVPDVVGVLHARRAPGSKPPF